MAGRPLALLYYHGGDGASDTKGPRCGDTAAPPGRFSTRGPAWHGLTTDLPFGGGGQSVDVVRPTVTRRDLTLG